MSTLLLTLILIAPADPDVVECEVNGAAYSVAPAQILNLPTHSLPALARCRDAAGNWSIANRQPLCGDAIPDGSVDIADATTIEWHQLGSDAVPFSVANCDVTGDDRCLSDDASTLKRHLLGLPPGLSCPPPPLCGDALADGTVDIVDATAIEQHLLGIDIPEFSFPNCDVTGDARCSSDDATALKRHLLGMPAGPTCLKPPLCGDAFPDGSVDIVDATAIEQYLLGIDIPEFSFPNCDVTGDGRCSSDDATALKRHLLGLLAGPTCLP